MQILFIREAKSLAHRRNQIQFRCFAVVLVIDDASHDFCQQITVDMPCSHMIADGLHPLHESLGQIHVAVLHQEVQRQRDGYPFVAVSEVVTSAQAEHQVGRFVGNLRIVDVILHKLQCSPDATQPLDSSQDFSSS